MSHAGSDSGPLSGEPSSVVSMVTRCRELFSVVLNDGIPHSAQQRIRIAHGVQAYAVWPAEYLYVHAGSGAPVAAPVASAARSDFNRKRVFGCHTNRRKSPVHITEKTPATTSVMRWKDSVLEAAYCMTANEPPETS